MNSVPNPFDFAARSPGQSAGQDSSPLIHLSPKDAFTMKHSFEGIFVAGQSGSGKTSGPGQALARAMLRNGFGFLITTTKPDDSSMWLNWARLEGREKDVRLFSPEQPWKFGILQYAYSQGGGSWCRRYGKCRVADKRSSRSEKPQSWYVWRPALLDGFYEERARSHD